VFLLITWLAGTLAPGKEVRFRGFSGVLGGYPPVFRFQDAPWVLALNNARLANTRLAKPNSEKSWDVFLDKPR